jgi:hypothetical protein
LAPTCSVNDFFGQVDPTIVKILNELPTDLRLIFGLGEFPNRIAGVGDAMCVTSSAG